MNEDEIPTIIECVSHMAKDMIMTLIETMPLGDIEGDRTDQYLPLSISSRAFTGSIAGRSRTFDVPYGWSGALCEA